jgi:hypothetical protein
MFPKHEANNQRNDNRVAIRPAERSIQFAAYRPNSGLWYSVNDDPVTEIASTVELCFFHGIAVVEEGHGRGERGEGARAQRASSARYRIY